MQLVISGYFCAVLNWRETAANGLSPHMHMIHIGIWISADYPKIKCTIVTFHNMSFPLNFPQISDIHVYHFAVSATGEWDHRSWARDPVDTAAGSGAGQGAPPPRTGHRAREQDPEWRVVHAAEHGQGTGQGAQLEPQGPAGEVLLLAGKLFCMFSGLAWTFIVGALFARNGTNEKRHVCLFGFYFLHTATAASVTMIAYLCLWCLVFLVCYADCEHVCSTCRRQARWSFGSGRSSSIWRRRTTGTTKTLPTKCSTNQRLVFDTVVRVFVRTPHTVFV